MTNDLPPDWTWARLEDLAAAEPRAITDGPFGSNLKTAHYTDSGPRVIRLQNIGDGVFRHEDAHISEEHYMSLVQHSVKAGDLVVASLGETLPRACLVPNWVPPAIVKADCIRVRLHPDLNPSYINFALQRPELRRETATLIKGVGRPRLGLQGIKSLAVPLAPLPQQTRIVAAIEEHFTRLDAAESALRLALQRVEALRSSLLADAFCMNARPPSDWKLATIGDVATVQLGRQRSPQHHAGSQMRPYLRAANVTWQGISLSNVKQMNFDDTDFAKYKLETGDLLLNEASGSPREIGKPAIWNGEIENCCFQNTLLRLRPHEIEVEYLYWYCYAAARSGRFGDAGRGVNIRHLGKQGLARFPILVAPMEHRGQIVDQLEDGFQQTSTLEQAAHSALDRVAALRRSVLAEAFAGRLVLQNPGDEPASVLLERIAAPRTTTPKQPRIRA
ncbi:MAG: restriction endonuclease subunit S [Acidimicrobiaceae bacterium]|nr:restriction endonuclease subunit S [Acidimicrobiaceae bacterium]MDE0515051.1 restriction endonuclease subunit S [Acidimicrobiaceae bacterium]